ncbi:hypothetical protein [Nocardia miyunensis]|uniref:hypothetical protein n=1 Tax=Nocardia miyunensis TaxID=282684 RepID=UPI00082AAD67|nr:hypothetical protein [Nocardia miyunensis]
MSFLFAARIVAGAALGVGLAASVAQADPLGPPGSACGPNMVVTDNHTCRAFNSSCTGYDMMVIGRVDHQGHCVVPGMNGTTP